MSINDRLSQVSNGACGIDRRGFLARCAGCSLVSGCMVGAWAGPVLGKPTAMEGRPRVRLVSSHIPRVNRPGPTSTTTTRRGSRQLTRRLVQGCPEIEFLPATVHTADAARAYRRGLGHGRSLAISSPWSGSGRGAQAIAEAGKPTLFVDDLYSGSGEFLIAHAAARRAGKNVAGVSSSRFQDVLTAARCFARVEDRATASRFAADCMAAVRKIPDRHGFWGRRTSVSTEGRGDQQVLQPAVVVPMLIEPLGGRSPALVLPRRRVPRREVVQQGPRAAVQRHAAGEPWRCCPWSK